MHNVKIKNGEFNIGDNVKLEVNLNVRRDTMKNHTATHLLHKALREVLGQHVHQAGSYVGPDRLRFDITHYESISKKDLIKVQDIVNNAISLGLPVVSKEMTLDESEKLGAIGLFEDKYKDIVRVINIGDKYSVELCGGTHVNTISDIQMFKIQSESSAAAGIRRIEAITGRAVYENYKTDYNLIDKIAIELKTDKNDLLNKSTELQKNIKELEKEINKLKEQDSKKDLDSIINDKKEIKGINYITHEAKNLDNKTFRNLGDMLRDKLASGIVVMSNVNEGKLNFLVLVTEDLISKKIFAGDIVKRVAELTGGKGGGRKDFAMAGGKDLSKVKIALDSVEEILDNLVK